MSASLFPLWCLPSPLTRLAQAPAELDPQAWVEVLPLGETERQALAPRLARLLEQAHLGTDKAETNPAGDLARALILPRLIAWNLRDPQGRPVPWTAEGLAALGGEWLGWIFAVVTGTDDLAATRAREQARDQALWAGIQLIRTAPQVAGRDCGDCQSHVYDERTGERALFQGAPLPRPAGTLPPCRIPQVGCPQGTPEAPRRLTPELWSLWQYDRQRRAAHHPAPTLEAARLSLLMQWAETAHG
ncbi:MAG: hypothetical protein ACK5TO_11635 [Planctomycetaceae bacterium]